MDVLQSLPCTLRQLQYLVAVAETGGFRRAAEMCHVSQPSLSAQIALAEGALGVKVFERDRRRVRVSRDGAVVLEHARRVLVAAQDLRQVARQCANPLAGTIRLGVIPTVCPYLLPDVAPALQLACPDLHLVWSEDRTASLIQGVRSGALDGAILALDVDMQGLEYAELLHDPFVLAAAPSHRLVQATTPASTDVLDGASMLLLEDGHCLRDQVLAHCSARGALDAGLRATSLATLVQMVSVSSGVTLLPSLAVPVENRRGQLRVRPFRPGGPSRTLVLAWRRGSALRAALDAVALTIRRVSISMGEPPAVTAPAPPLREPAASDAPARTCHASRSSRA